MTSNVQRLNLSIVVCSVRPLNCIAMLSSLVSNAITKSDEVIIIFDTKIDDEIETILTKNFGLSYCRNHAIEIASNDHIIFFDDDVILPKDTIGLYRYYFGIGYSAIGGPMKLPNFYPNIPKWLPPGYSSLLGIHTNQKKIWGANFGFVLNLAKHHSIIFNEQLGRKGGGTKKNEKATGIRLQGRDSRRKQTKKHEED